MEILQKVVKIVSDYYRENDMKILTRVKYASMVTAPVLSSFATVRAMKEIEARKRERGKDIPLKEKIKIGVQNGISTVAVTALGIFASAKIDKQNADTIEALTTAVVVGDRNYRELKAAQKEVVGDEKSKEIEDKQNSNAIANTQVITDPSKGIYACREPKTGQIWATTPKKIDNAITYVYRQTAAGNDVSLEELIVEAGGDPSELGEKYGFKGKLGVEYNIFTSTTYDRNGCPCYYISYGVDSVPVLLD